MIDQLLTARLWMLIVDRLGLRRASKIAGKPGGAMLFRAAVALIGRMGKSPNRVARKGRCYQNT